MKLSHETFVPVFDGNDINKIFNYFVNSLLSIYSSNFLLNQAKNKMNQSSWITPGIITSCTQKRELCKELQNNNNVTAASYYTDYSKILSMVIRKTKIIENDKLILRSHNKVKTAWGIINKEYGRNKKVYYKLWVLKVEKLLINKLLLKLLMSILLLSQKMLKDRVKVIL